MDEQRRTPGLLVVLTGPVGAGKSTTALALANRFRQAGRKSAVIDLDVVYCMARQVDGFLEEDVWRAARHGAAALAETFLEAGMEVVIIEGGILTKEERDEVRRVDWAVVKSVTIDVSFEETARRVEADPSRDRVATRDLNILRLLYAQYVDALPFLKRSSWVVDASSSTAEQLAEQIDELLSLRGSEETRRWLRQQGISDEAIKKIEDFERHGISAGPTTYVEPPPSKSLVVMAEYASDGIWPQDDGSVEALNLPESLTQAFADWIECYWPAGGVEMDVAQFVADGRELARRLKEHVGLDVRVVYQPETIPEEIELPETRRDAE